MVRIKRMLIIFVATTVLAACSALPQAVFDQSESTPTAIRGTDEVDAALPQETPPGDRALKWSVVARAFIEESEHPPYEVDICWPNLEGNPDLAAVFNTEIDRRVNEAVSFFRADVSALGDASGTSPKSFFNLEYTVTFNEGGLVSLYLMFDTYIALSAHPLPSSWSLNYDLAGGRFLTLADLFAPEGDFLAVVLDWVESDLLSRDLGYTPGTAAGVLEARDHWNLLPEGLRINFDVYEVGPYAAGYQYILIPWENLAPYLNPDVLLSVFAQP